MLEGFMNRMNQNHQQQLVMEESLSNLTSASGEASNSSINPSINGELAQNNFPTAYNPPLLHHQQQQQQEHYQNPSSNKRKRSLPGNPDPDSEVIALSPKSLMAKNRFLCEICNKGFQRDQNLQLHRRGHNLPWKLKQRSKTEVVRKKVYVCPEISCVHHDPSRALGDLTGIKKHFCRKHGEKKWKCDKCSKKYAVQSDWKAHSKICGTREYKCDCGTLFSRRDSFITHRAFCDVLAEEAAARTTASNPLLLQTPPPSHHHHQMFGGVDQNHQQMINTQDLHPPLFSIKQELQQHQGYNLIPPWLSSSTSSSSSPVGMNAFSHGLLQRNPNGQMGISGGAHFGSSEMSATAMLQKAAQIGATMSTKIADQQQQEPPQYQFGGAATSDGQRVPPDHVPVSTAGFGLNLSSHEQQQQQINNNNNNEDGFFSNGSSSSSQMFFSDIMMSSLSNSFNGDHHHNDGLTKDFLGLRHLSTSDILSIAGLGNSINNFTAASSSNSHQDHQDLHNKSWQG
ncbi:hypothetical protein V2J09_005310 [Rumex salicifolius]